MDTGTGISSSGGHPPEPIVSISHHYTGHFLLGNLHYHCLIITAKRIICVNTDGLVAAARNRAPGGNAPARAGLLDHLLMALSRNGAGRDFSRYFLDMHPSEIVAAHPEAIGMPVSSVESFVVWKGKRFWYADSPSPDSYYWVTEITGRGGVIRLFTRTYPGNILENYPLIRLFPGKFFPPTKDNISWLFGKKIDP